MKSKTLVMTIATLIVIILSVWGCSSYGSSAQPEGNEWISELGYEESEVHELTFSGSNDRSCPEIPVEIGDKEYKLTFDTGCAVGLNLTNEIGNKINYTLLGETELYKRDGSHQGWAKHVQVDEMNVLGDSYRDIETNISDWSLFSSRKFNGNIGLAYFKSKVVTLDYAGHKIAVGSKPVDYTALKSDKYVVLPLYETASKGKQDLLFFKAKYMNKPVIVYMDTGKNYSYLHNPNSKNTVGNMSADLPDIILDAGDMDLVLKDLTEANIAQEDGLPYQTIIEMNSDQIWKCNLLVTIDLIEQKIIFCKS